MGRADRGREVRRVRGQIGSLSQEFAPGPCLGPPCRVYSPPCDCELGHGTCFGSRGVSRCHL